ncbi:MAG TPA: DUF721 domain-containing protein [Gaiellaceae bacterium]|jgi:hypothetical protein
MDRIGDAVRSELGRFGTAAPMADLVALWPQVVGEAVAANAWPARLSRDGTLLVNTSSSAWAFELGHLESEIRPRLGEHAPPRIKFAPGPLPEPAPAASEDARKPAPEPTPQQAEQAREWVAAISSEELRKTVEKAARASLARAAADRSFW